MDVYLVGGAVRDELLGLPITERDWVVVGATPEHLLHHGFTQVGKNFPVFLHPKTHEEYALARTERKNGKGYHGFICDFSKEVSLEDDLKRRDLTINAIAKSTLGEFIDPYQGQEDLKNKILRHVSEAFIEDPLRVLRVARFYARFYDLGFKIAPDTLQMMQAIVCSGELQHLSVERIWTEWYRAFKGPHPEIFIQTLNTCQALPSYLANLDTGKLADIASRTKDADIRLCLYLKDLDENDLMAFCKAFKLPKQLCKAMENYKKHHRQLDMTQAQHAADILKTLEELDAFRQTKAFLWQLECFAVDDHQNTKTAIWYEVVEACLKIRLPKEMQTCNDIAKIQDFFHQTRVDLIKQKVFKKHEK